MRAEMVLIKKNKIFKFWFIMKNYITLNNVLTT